MAFGPGTRVGRYEVTALIGEGGMGKVWRAHHPGLKRDDALKVLPDGFAADPERLARFQREAQVLASFNHPNIAHVYGLEDVDGEKALVMELVEGPTLADRIKQGPIPIDEALPIAKQIAEALEAAHEQGIIHRDLKPANVKVREDGTVKVLDFGLAKAMEPTGAASPSASQSPTITTPAMTQAGMILGTAACMSPEQARGKPVDKRADIWAFGCVLFEMLAGTLAFPGDDVTDTIVSVIGGEPDWSALPSTLSPALSVFLRRCLQKNAKQRVHDIADVRLALEGAFEPMVPQVAEAATIALPTWKHAMPLAVATLVVGVLVTGLVAWRWWPSVEAQPVNRFGHALGDGQALRNPAWPAMAVSPDGRHFVYNTTEGLYLRTLGGLTAQLIPGTEENLIAPIFSPDGQSIAYATPRQIKRIAITGGVPVVVGDYSWTGNVSGSWSRDDTILLGRPEGILRVAATGGTPNLIIPSKEGERLYGPQLLPDGDSVLFSVTTGDWDEAQIVVQSLATGQRTVLRKGGNDARYLSTGHLVYALGNGLFAMAFNLDSLTVSGGAVPLVQGVMRTSSTGGANYAVSDDGTLVYVTASAAGQRTLVWADRQGREEVLGAAASSYVYPRISPDGSRVALDDRNEAGDLWVWDFAAETRTRMTVGEDGGSYPVWTPDGERIAYESGGDFAWKAANNTGTVEQLANAPGQQGSGAPNPYFFTPTGAALVFRDPDNPRTDDNIGMVALEDGAESVWLLNEPFNERNAELFYLEPGSPLPRLMSVVVELDSIFSVGMRTRLFDWPYRAAAEGRDYDVSSDGQRFLAIREGGPEATGQAQFVVVQHWFTELERLVPVD